MCGIMRWGLGKRSRDWCAPYSVYCEDKTALLLGECATRGALAVGMGLSGHSVPSLPSSLW